MNVIEEYSFITHFRCIVSQHMDEHGRSISKTKLKLEKSIRIVLMHVINQCSEYRILVGGRCESKHRRRAIQYPWQLLANGNKKTETRIRFLVLWAPKWVEKNERMSHEHVSHDHRGKCGFNQEIVIYFEDTSVAMRITVMNLIRFPART